MRIQYEVVEHNIKYNLDVILYNGSKRYFKDLGSAKKRIADVRQKYPDLKEDKFTIRKRQVEDWQFVEEL